MSTLANPQFAVGKQSCTMSSLYRPLLAYGAGAALLLYAGKAIAAVTWLAAAPLIKVAYVRVIFPRISQRIGYASLADRLPAGVSRAALELNYYSFVGCPFCPIMEQRLDSLQRQMGFHLNRIDVTLKPQILTRKGIRSVPVIEIGEKRLIGHATTEQLAEFIATASAQPNR